MAIAKLYNLVRVTTTTPGTGTLNLGSAVPGYLSFADGGCQNGDVVSYGIKDGTASEVGRGTYNSAGPTLSRDTVVSSTNGNAAINLTGTNAEVFITPLVEDFDFTGNLASNFWTRSDVPSAATCDIGAAITPCVRITGTTTITSFGTGANRVRFVEFAGSLLLTYNGTSLVLPGTASIITQAGDKGIFVSDASGNWRCVSWMPLRFLPKEALTSSRTYYIRTDGSDSNTGLANTSGGAFLTIQKAVDTVATLDLNGFSITIQIADGTYTGGTTLKNVVGFSVAGALVIRGNNTTPANVVISTTSVGCFTANGTNVIWDILDLKMQTTTGGACLQAQSGGAIRYGNVNFGACANVHIGAFENGSVSCIGNYSISGGALAHFYGSYMGLVRATSRSITITNTPAFSLAFAFSDLSGLVAADAMTFSGSATGPRYYVATGGQVATGGGGTSYLPGNAAGTGTNFGTSPYGLYS